MDTGGRQKARVSWRSGDVPVSTRFDDPYFSHSDGLAEARHVHLAGNGLPERFRPGFHVAELGFGTGLNALAAALAWNASGMTGSLRLTSFEAFPMSAGDMDRALARWPELAGPLVAAWGEGVREIVLPGLELHVIEGDARATLPEWGGRADAWFLDGFSPDKNPEMWEQGLLAEVARHTSAGGTFATYTAAGSVRRGLEAAGFAVERVRGYGTKRHMSRGVMDG
jgi:tRNA U34 5-methylaminomethyl-2-thiouridine-forming methyltransferase MnmC